MNFSSTVANATGGPMGERNSFTLLDYSFFGALLGLSAAIGIYYGFFSKHKQNTTKEYILGGKTMSTFPISVSLVASHVSGITLLGIPVEVYANGTQYCAFIIPAIALAFLLIYVYLPVFVELQLTSSFEYLEQRFDHRVRLVASAVYALSGLAYLPIVMYVPALAFSQVTGIDLHYITPIICAICVFYTTIGGLRAVVWTDTLQFGLMMAAIMAIIFLGIQETGSLTGIWEAADRGGRLILFNLDPSPLVRTSFWTISIGLTVTWISNMGVNQSCIQKFLSVPDMEAAKRSVWIFVAGLILIKSSTLITGLLLYAKYENCDPVSAGFVQKTDQVLPYYVMEVGGSIPGLPGLFIAGIFAAALSTLSAHLNTLAGTIYVDFLQYFFPKANEKQASNTMKLIVIVLGAINISLVYVVESLGSVFQMANSLHGITGGALLGMFTIGMVSRSANTKGVVAGVISSLIVVTVLLVGAQRFKVNKSVNLPLSTSGCNSTTDAFANSTAWPIETTTLVNTLETTVATTLDTTEATPSNETNEVFWIFRISFMYYALIGLIMTFLVGLPVSWLTGGTKHLNEALLSPICRSVEYKKRKSQGEAQYSEIGRALFQLQSKQEDEF